MNKLRFHGSLTILLLCLSPLLPASATAVSLTECRYLSKFELNSVADNVGKSLRQILLSAQYTGNELTGYWIKHVSANSIFSTYGLKRGDLILGLNNIKLSDQNRWAQEITNLKQMTDFSLQIKRQQQQITLKFILSGELQCD